MIIKRIRKHAKRRHRSLSEISTIANVLSAYVLNASADPALVRDGENALAQYVLDAQVLAGHSAQPGEKVDIHGTRCLIGHELAMHQQQILAATFLVPHAKDPIEHYMLSWRADEFPTSHQVEEAIDIFAEEMGYQNCQIIWATHSNTANYHLHLVVNRIDLVRQKVASPGDGWEIDRLHQVTALIEDAQGWAAEPNAIYKSKAGEVRERVTDKVVRLANGSREGCYHRRKAAPERWREESHQKIGDELRAAVSWQDLHNRLSKLNAEYRQKGSGAEIAIGSVRMKATSFGREFSYGRMIKKLGEFTPDPLRERDPYEDYLAAVRKERERVREAWNEALADIRARRKLLLKKDRLEKESYETIIAEARLKLCFDLAEAETNKAFDRARATIAANKLRRDAWYNANCPKPDQVTLPELIFTPNLRRDEGIAKEFGLAGSQCNQIVEYRREDGRLAIRDVGVALIVDPIDKNAIAAGLALAHTRGGHIPITGSKHFQRICREIAIARGYKLTLHSGEVLYDPAEQRRKVVEPKPVLETVSKPAPLSVRLRTDSEANSAKPTGKRASSPSNLKKSSNPDQPHKEADDHLSDAIRWAAMKSGKARSGL